MSTELQQKLAAELFSASSTIQLNLCHQEVIDRYHIVKTSETAQANLKST